MPDMWSEASRSVVHIAEEIIQKYHPDLAEANIGFLFREKAQESAGKVILGKASKVPERLKPFLDYDFIIWVSEEDWPNLSASQKEALIDHELTHCKMVDGIPKMRHHDIEEFQSIIERHGIWNSELAAFATALQESPQMKLSLQFMDLRNCGRVEAIPQLVLDKADLGIE